MSNYFSLLQNFPPPLSPFLPISQVVHYCSFRRMFLFFLSLVLIVFCFSSPFIYFILFSLFVSHLSYFVPLLQFSYLIHSVFLIVLFSSFLTLLCSSSFHLLSFIILPPCFPHFHHISSSFSSA